MYKSLLAPLLASFSSFLILFSFVDICIQDPIQVFNSIKLLLRDWLPQHSFRFLACTSSTMFKLLSPLVSYHIISYHIISYHIISYHIISYHIISYHIISYHIISYHIISYHIIFIYIYSLFTHHIHSLTLQW